MPYARILQAPYAHATGPYVHATGPQAVATGVMRPYYRATGRGYRAVPDVTIPHLDVQELLGVVQRKVCVPAAF